MLSNLHDLAIDYECCHHPENFKPPPAMPAEVPSLPLGPPPKGALSDDPWQEFTNPIGDDNSNGYTAVQDRKHHGNKGDRNQTPSFGVSQRLTPQPPPAPIKTSNPFLPIEPEDASGYSSGGGQSALGSSRHRTPPPPPKRPARKCSSSLRLDMSDIPSEAWEKHRPDKYNTFIGQKDKCSSDCCISVALEYEDVDIYVCSRCRHGFCKECIGQTSFTSPFDNTTCCLSCRVQFVKTKQDAHVSSASGGPPSGPSSGSDSRGP